MSNTTAGKLAYLDGTKTAIRTAIETKTGDTIPAETPFREYADLITNLQTGVLPPEDPADFAVEPWAPHWVNPATGLLYDIRDCAVGEIKMLTLTIGAIFNVTTTGSVNYFVDWGDGVTTEHASAATCEHKYLTPDPYAVIRVYGAGGANISYLQGASATGVIFPIDFPNQILWVVCNCTLNIQLDGSCFPVLESFESLDTVISASTGIRDGYTLRHFHVANLITDGNYLLQNCTGIHSIVWPNNQSASGLGESGAYAKYFRLLYRVDSSKVTAMGLQACRKIVVDEGVKTLSALGAGCYSLKELVLPSTLTSMEECFNYNKLRQVSLPAGMLTMSGSFQYSSELEEVSLPDGLATTNSCFAYSPRLIRASVPSGKVLCASSSSARAFYGSPLAELMVRNTSASLPSNFAQTPDLFGQGKAGAGITGIGAYAFIGCTSLGNVEAVSPLLSIGDAAFGDCSSLRELDISSATSIGESALQSCSLLKEIAWPMGVAMVPSSVLANTYLLERLYVPDTVTLLGAFALQYSGITSLSLPDSCVAYHSSGSPLRGCAGLKEVTIRYKSGVMPNGALQWCSLVEKVVVSEGVTAIGAFALYGMTSMKEISLPSTLLSLGDSCFVSCVSLRKVTVPSSVTSWGASANPEIFYSAFSLEEITFHGTLASTTLTTPVTYCPSLAKLDMRNTKFNKLVISGTGAAPSSFVRLGEKGNIDEYDVPVMVDWTGSPWSGTSPQIDMSFTALSRAQIVGIFNKLPTVTGKDIRLFGTSGSASLTAEDRAIATAKGWSVNTAS